MRFALEKPKVKHSKSNAIVFLSHCFSMNRKMLERIAWLKKYLMKSKETQTTKDNYLAGPDDLQLLTRQFRSGLTEWCDEKTNEPKLVEIDGENQPLLCASITELLDYAVEYTKRWKSIPEQQKEDFKNIWFIDCRGLYISSMPDFNYAERDNTQDWAPVQFDYSVIKGRCLLFTCKIFLGYASFFKTEFLGNVYFNQTQFNKEAIFDGVDFKRDALFSECEFKFNKSASFQQTTFSKRADFTGTSFNRVPQFHETKLPQATSFRGAKFNKSGSDLSQQDIHQEVIASRTLRQIAASYKSQQDESMFFALEQRYYRKDCLALRLVWYKQSMKTCLQGQQGLKDLFLRDTWKHWSYWSIRFNLIECFISWFYDWVSEYGTNPKMAVCRLIVLNAVALLIYYLVFAIDNSSFLLSKNASVLAQQYPAFFFSLQNLLNPSGIVSSSAVVTVNNLFIAILAFIHSISTYIVLTLTALAIRAKFQKSAGGN